MKRSQYINVATGIIPLNMPGGSTVQRVRGVVCWLLLSELCIMLLLLTVTHCLLI